MPTLEVREPLSGKSILQKYNDEFMTEQELNLVLAEIEPWIRVYMKETPVDIIDLRLYRIAHVKKAMEVATLRAHSSGIAQ